MSEQYSEYRRQRGRKKQKNSFFTYSKKFKHQLIFSVLCLSAVFLLQASETNLANTVRNSIKTALTYEVDTTSFKDFITDMINLKITNGG